MSFIINRYMYVIQLKLNFYSSSASSRTEEEHRDCDNKN